MPPLSDVDWPVLGVSPGQLKVAINKSEAGPSKEASKKPEMRKYLPKAEKQSEQLQSVKRSLSSILLPEHKERITHKIEEMCIEATKICVLASLAMLDTVNRAFNNKDWEFFLQQPMHVVTDCFNSILIRHENDALLSEDFVQLMLLYNINRPSSRSLSNSLKYLRNLYLTNMKNNIAGLIRRRVCDC